MGDAPPTREKKTLSAKGNPCNRRLRPRRKSRPLQCGVAPAAGRSTVRDNARALLTLQTRPSQPGVLAAEKPRSAKCRRRARGAVAWLSEAGRLASHMSHMPGGCSQMFCHGASAGQSATPLPACARLAGLKRTRLAGRWAKRARRLLLKSSA